MILKNTQVPEISLVIHPSELKEKNLKFDINANSAVRNSLSKRFGLIAVNKFQLSLNLQLLESIGVMKLKGHMIVSVVQNCVITLERIINHIDEVFEIKFQEYGNFEVKNVEFEGEFESYTNDRIDIGEVSVQEFGLRLDPYPRSVSASYKRVESYMRPKNDNVNHPFSALADLKAKK